MPSKAKPNKFNLNLNMNILEANNLISESTQDIKVVPVGSINSINHYVSCAHNAVSYITPGIEHIGPH